MVRALLVAILLCALSPVRAQFIYENQKLLPPDPVASGQFGYRVAISQNGEVALVGEAGRGRTHVYRRTPGGWQHEQTIVRSGRALAISADGEVVLIGVWNQRRGFIFRRDEHGVWTEVAALQAPAYDFELGAHVALSADARVALLFASARVHVFRQNEQNAWVYAGQLGPPGGTWSGFWGEGMSLSADGSVALVGAKDHQGAEGSGAAHVYRRQGDAWVHEKRLRASDVPQVSGGFGYRLSLSADGRSALIGAFLHPGGGQSAGAFYYFVYEQGEWTERQRVLGKYANQSLGAVVVLAPDGLSALVSAHDPAAPPGSSRGRVRIYRLEDDSWNHVATLAPREGHQNDGFGRAALSATGHVIMGARGDASLGMQSHGAAYLYDVRGITVGAEAPSAAAGRGVSVYPNPSSGEASVEVVLERPESVRVVVYDVLGREVRRLHEGTLAAGVQRLSLSGLAPGVYLVRVQAGAWQQARRMVVR
jgi:hypothetical protein